MKIQCGQVLHLITMLERLTGVAKKRLITKFALN